MTPAKSKVQRLCKSLVRSNSVLLSAYEAFDLDLEREVFLAGIENAYWRGRLDAQLDHITDIRNRLDDIDNSQG